MCNFFLSTVTFIVSIIHPKASDNFMWESDAQGFELSGETAYDDDDASDIEYYHEADGLANV